MIFIVVKFPVKPEYTEKWLDLTRNFTEATPCRTRQQVV